MTEDVLHYLEVAGSAITLFAVAVIVVGFALAAGRYVRRWGAVSRDQNFQGFKVNLGHALTLGLSILVLGDVIETMTVDSTFRSLAVLAFLLVLRTILSWTLTLEIDGHWPWQAPAEEPENG